MTGWEFKAIDDYGGPGTLSDLLADNIQVADIYTTTPSIKQNDLVVLKDPKNLIAAQNIVPLLGEDYATDEVAALLNPVSAALTTDELLNLNEISAGDDKPSPDAVAKAWLTDNGFLKTTPRGLRSAAGGIRPALLDPQSVLERVRVAVAGVVPVSGLAPLDQLLDHHDPDPNTTIAATKRYPAKCNCSCRARRAARDDPTDRHVGGRPDRTRGSRPAMKLAVAHRAHADGDRHERVQYRQKPRHEDGDTAASVDVVLGAMPVLDRRCDARAASRGCGDRRTCRGRSRCSRRRGLR